MDAPGGSSSQAPQTGQIPLVGQAAQTGQIPPVGQAGQAAQTGQIPPVGQAAQAAQTGQIPPVGQAAQAPQTGQIPPVGQAAQAPQGAQPQLFGPMQHIMGRGAPALVEGAPDIKPNGRYDTGAMLYNPAGGNQPHGSTIAACLED